MKHALLKSLGVWALMTMCLGTPPAWGQQPPQPCHIMITGDFESQCILMREKEDYDENEPETILACQDNQVKYTATTNTGSYPVTQWNWTVVGAASWIDHHNGSITVIWGSGTSGQIGVEITTSNGYSCSKTQNVKLIERPEIYVRTTPYYEEQGGTKVIYVCKGETVEFTDLSATTNTDITGYYWETSTGIIASSANLSVVANVPDIWVTHRVYNNCGCYDEEKYVIKVMKGDLLEVDCYGTVCENAVVTYVATSPSCNQYSWYVEGGTILEGQDQPKVTVRWDRSEDGYGLLALDGNLCGNNACPTMLSKKIPIMQSGISVRGQETACVGDGVIYSVPLYGSTEYHWDIQPAGLSQVYDVNGANQKMIIFTQPGTYTISVKYKCDFLECGEMTSDTLTVVAKPKLYIQGEDRVCITNACDLKTNPSENVRWTVIDMSNNQTIYNGNNTTLAYTFPHTGKYRITAEHPNYCRPAEMVVTVVNTPPAPTINDMDPSNPHVACLNSGIMMKANPTNPNYSLLWRMSCGDDTVSYIPGNEVTLSFGDTVCDVYAYNFDRVLGCVSEGAYVHTVSEFQLAPSGLPTDLTVCPNETLGWSVPLQSKVVYEWTIESGNVRYGSIQGPNYNNSVTFFVNEVPGTHQFDVYLKRTYCSDMVEYDTIHITVTDNMSTSLSIDPVGPLCQYEIAQLVGHGCDGDVYNWTVTPDNNTHIGNNWNYAFMHHGNIKVTLACNPYDVCNNSDYFAKTSININVLPAPPVNKLGTDGTNVFVVPTLPSGYHYQWSHTTTDAGSVPRVPGQNTYSCTITGPNGCTITRSATFGIGPECTYLTVLAYPDIDYCNKEIHFQVANNPHVMLGWELYGGGHGALNEHGTYHEFMDATVSDVGYYEARVHNVAGNICYAGEVTYVVDFLPDFTFEKDCNRIIVHNNSKYLDPNKQIVVRVNNTNYPIYTSTPSFVVNTGSGGTFTFILKTYDTHTLNCNLGTVTITNTGGSTLSITSSNPTSCENTPIQFTATPGSGFKWSFGDGSGYNLTSGNSIYHTYEFPYTYNVTASRKDSEGCLCTGTLTITNYSNVLKPESLLPTTPYPTCPGTNRILQFTPSTTTPTPVFSWSTPPPIPIPIHPVNQTGDYNVIVTNSNTCRVQAYRNVQFLNRPTAFIVTASSVYCVGEKIKFYGAPDPDTTQYTFAWTITDPNNHQTQYSNATFCYTPTVVGNYTINFTITNAGGCSDNTTSIIYVNPTPSAPSVTFGGNQCIDQPPVEMTGVSGTTPASTIHWSNGNTGTIANYYTPGWATAWYYDATTGCKSDETKFHIEPAPDFDALLTGCYEKCKRFFEPMHHLPVWGLSSGYRSIDWKWFLNSNNIDGGTTYFPGYPLSLPLPGYGDYELELKYNNSICGPLVSPTLTIKPKQFCDCENLEVSYNILDIAHDGCKLHYKVEVIVCNTGAYKTCVSELEKLFDTPGIELEYTDFYPHSIDPNDCDTFYMTITAAQFYPSSVVSYRILNHCDECTVDFSIDLMPYKIIDCEEDMPIDIHVRPDLSSNVAGYFDFHAHVEGTEMLFAFWTEPPMVIKFWYDGGVEIHGFGMVDMALLTQMIEEGGEFCFYAITCRGGELCKRRFCIPADELYHIILEQSGMGAFMNGSANGDEELSPEDASAPRLMPNPTTGEVNVIGTTDKVLEVLVMDMNGREMTTFTNAVKFDISDLPSGIYIVRVMTQHDENSTAKVDYLKLVKK